VSDIHDPGYVDQLLVDRDFFKQRLDQTEEKLEQFKELARAFMLAEIDTMTRNNLGDPEKQHNVKWARSLGL
jgi:hypothetical protein